MDIEKDKWVPVFMNLTKKFEEYSSEFEEVDFPPASISPPTKPEVDVSPTSISPSSPPKSGYLVDGKVVSTLDDFEVPKNNLVKDERPSHASVLQQLFPPLPSKQLFSSLGASTDTSRPTPPTRTRNSIFRFQTP